MDALSIRPAELSDAPVLTRIYNYYVSHTVVTFEEAPLTDDDMAGRVSESRAASLPWIVAELSGVVVGYAYASKWKGRCAYRYSVETTVYLDNSTTSRGIGSKLYRGASFTESVPWACMQRSVASHFPIHASVALHERLGFRHVGTFHQVGYKQGRWVDVGYWQVQL